MKPKSSFTVNRKEVGIFFLIAYLLPYLLGIFMGYSFYQGNDVSIFPNAQMYYPAAGVILAFLITRKSDAMPKRFYIGFLITSGLMAIGCVLSCFLFQQSMFWALFSNYVVILSSIVLWILLLTEKKEKRFAFGLTFSGHGKKKPFLYVGIFLLLYFVRILISSFFDGSYTQLAELFSTPYPWVMLVSLPINFFLVFTAFFGEEYGWRYYLQPLLQNRFGKRAGVLLLGVIWGLWHLPINIFYYSPDTWLQSIVAQQITCISLGVFFAYAYMKTENIWVPVILHFLNNNLVVVFTGTASSISNQVIRWTDILILLVINAICFLPFLLSKVFREEEKNSIE